MNHDVIDMGNLGLNAVLDLIGYKMSFFKFPDLEGQVCFDEFEFARISASQDIDFAD
jgi:hypothetical protein